MKKLTLIKILLLNLCLLGMIASLSPAAHAVLRVDINQGDFQPLPIAFLEFESFTNAGRHDGQLEKIGKNVVSVIQQNLILSGLFRKVPQQDFVQRQLVFSGLPDFEAWRLINTQALLVGKVTRKNSREIEISFRLWDIFSQKQVTALSYQARTSGWRRVAHKISDDIYYRITGEEGYFDTRIIYISETGSLKNRIKQLAIMDQDGANTQIISQDKGLPLTPRFSPVRQEILYMRIFRRVARVYWFDLLSGTQISLGEFEGMYYAPRFTASGNAVLLSYAQHGNSDVWYMDLRTLEKRRLTRHPGIDTSPTASPDGKFIAFTSDRGGTPQIYTMRNHGGNVKRITYGRGYFTTPVWSPRGDLIAFTRQSGGRFSVGVIKPNGKNMRILFSDYHVEAPTWSPNGRVLMFFKREKSNFDGSGGRTRIFSVDVTGRNFREIPTTSDASDPSWSPIIP